MARCGGYDTVIIGLVTWNEPAPIRSAWVTLRVGARHNAEPHVKGAGHEPVMNEGTVCRLDVHADTIAVAVASRAGRCAPWGVIPNRPESIRKLVKQLGSSEHVRGLLRGGPYRVCHLLAVDRARRAVRGGRTHVGAGEGRRSREDGSAAMP